MASRDGTFLELRLRQRKWWVRVPFLKPLHALFSLERRGGSYRLAVRGSAHCCLPQLSVAGKREAGIGKSPQLWGSRSCPLIVLGERARPSAGSILVSPSSDPKPALATRSLSPGDTSLIIPASVISRLFCQSRHTLDVGISEDRKPPSVIEAKMLF